MTRAKVSPACSSPSLSDIDEFPWFARTCASDGLSIHMITDFLVKHRSVARAGVLSDNSDYCASNINRFKADWVTAGGDIVGEWEKWEEGKLTPGEAKEILVRMAEGGVKVFILCDYETDDLVVKDAAFDLGLTSNGAACVLPNTLCSAVQSGWR